MQVSCIELPLQLLLIDDQILVVCTGFSGEAFAFVEKSKVDFLFKRSINLHRQIDGLIDKQTRDESGTPSGGNQNKNFLSIQRRNIAREMKELGEFMFNEVFKERILDLFNITIGQAIRLDSSVVIKLMIASDFLNVIPWELLCDKGTFLSHTYDLLRHPFAIQPVRNPFTLDSNIRVLFVGGNPRNDIYVQDQLTTVQNAIRSISSEPKCLVTPEATYTSIADEIYKGTDILHFLALGEYALNGSKPQGYFLIDGEGEKKEDRLPIEMLQSFCRASPMQLAVLSACRSDQGFWYNSRSSRKVHKTGYYSMAHALFKIGVPSVIGMSHPISKVGAGILAKRLYNVLVNQKETINKAIRQVRLELFAHTDDLLPSDWMAPVLYSRVTTPTIQQPRQAES